MALALTPVHRLFRDYDVTATLPDGSPADLGGVDAALLPPRVTPTAATVWAPTDYVVDPAPAWRVLLAGPDADPTGALVVPPGGADLWLRVVDGIEVDAALIERISLR